MNRIYKHYNFQLADKSTAAKQVSFSSYPGFLESLDDFYLMDSGLGMVQTTNNVFNSALYEKITTHSLLAWYRVRAATQMAHTGQEWYETVKRYNSGTYNNMVSIERWRGVFEAASFSPLPVSLCSPLTACSMLCASFPSARSLHCVG